MYKILLFPFILSLFVGCGGGASSTLVGNPLQGTAKAFTMITNECENDGTPITISQTSDDIYFLGGFSGKNGFYSGTSDGNAVTFSLEDGYTCNLNLADDSFTGTCTSGETSCGFEYGLNTSIEGCSENVYLTQGQYYIVPGLSGAFESDTHFDLTRDVQLEDANYFAGVLNMFLIGQPECSSGSFNSDTAGPTVTTTYDSCSFSGAEENGTLSGYAYMQFLCDAVYIEIITETNAKYSSLFIKSTEGNSNQCSSWTLYPDGSAACND